LLSFVAPAQAGTERLSSECVTGSPPSRGRRTRCIVPAHAGTERLFGRIRHRVPAFAGTTNPLRRSRARGNRASFRSDPPLGPRLRGDDEPGPSFPRMREPSVFSVGPVTGSPPSRGLRTRSIVPAHAGTERLFGRTRTGPRLRGDDEPGPSFARPREPERLFRSDPPPGPRLQGGDEPAPSFPRQREPSVFRANTP